jgi:uncharacterized membrane protein YvbJ
MNNCPACGHQRQGEEKKCPHCQIFYSSIDEFLAEEEEREQKDWFKTRFKRVWSAVDRKQALRAEWEAYCATLPRGSGFVVYVILAFVFAMIIVVL